MGFLNCVVTLIVGVLLGGHSCDAWGSTSYIPPPHSGVFWGTYRVSTGIDFVSIATRTNAILLNFGIQTIVKLNTSVLTGFDGSIFKTTMAENDYNYSSSLSDLNSFYVAKNGDVIMNNGSVGTEVTDASVCGGNSLDNPCGSDLYPHIAVMGVSMANFMSGKVYFLRKRSSIIISFEKMYLFNASYQNLNGQVEIYADGTFDLRYYFNISTVLPYTIVMGLGAATLDNISLSLPFGECNQNDRGYVGFCSSFLPQFSSAAHFGKSQ